MKEFRRFIIREVYVCDRITANNARLIAVNPVNNKGGVVTDPILNTVTTTQTTSSEVLLVLCSNACSTVRSSKISYIVLECAIAKQSQKARTV